MGQYQHINDSLAFVVHLSFLKQNCKLIGLTEEQYLDDLGSIPFAWNKSNEIYTFRYILKSEDKEKNKEEQKNNDEQPKNTILVKVLSMEKNECLITAIKQGSNDVFTLEITLSDHLETNKGVKDLNDYKALYKDINGLIVLLNDQITNKVIPQKKEEKKKEDEKKKEEKNRDPLIYPDPINPNPNPLFIGGGRGGGGIPFGGGGPFGGGDMDPFGGNGGNLMGPNQINRQWANRNNPNRPPNVPDGARFDPFGPGRDFPGGPDPNHFKPPGRKPGGGGGFGGFGGII